MLDRINTQDRILNDTNKLLSKHKESSESLINAALDYSSKFDTAKLEKIIKRELNLEHAEEIINVRQGLEKIKQNAVKLDKNYQKNIDALEQRLFEIAQEGAKSTIHLLLGMPHNSRQEFINTISNVQWKNIIQTAFDLIIESFKEKGINYKEMIK